VLDPGFMILIIPLIELETYHVSGLYVLSLIILAMAFSEVKQYAIVGSGVRSAFDYRESSKTSKAMPSSLEYAQTRLFLTSPMTILSSSAEKACRPTKPRSFDRMIEDQKPDVLTVAAIDCFHHVYCIRALELGYDAIAETP
jgi:predicted dehydrogenase